MYQLYLSNRSMSYHSTMHAVAGIHSAMAIKRQRHRREMAARERERRLSTHSSESGDTHHSLHGSTRRKHRQHTSGPHGSAMLDTKVVTSIGMLHIGVVFLVFGIFLFGAGLLPNDVSGIAISGEPCSNNDNINNLSITFKQ